MDGSDRPFFLPNSVAGKPISHFSVVFIGYSTILPLIGLSGLSMKYAFWLTLAAVFTSATCAAQGDAIYRCGNEYTNTVTQDQAKNCKLIKESTVTVIPATKVPKSSNAKSESADQKSKESDARLILESELRKATSRRDELQKDFNNGQPEKMGPEHLNNQRYLDRIESMKAEIARNQADIDGIKRELIRLGGSSASQ